MTLLTEHPCAAPAASAQDARPGLDIEAPSLEAVKGFYSGMRPFWHPVLREADLPDGQLVRVELLGEGIALARLNGKVTALRDLCRHFQARLSLGEIITLDGEQAVMCKYHGWTYGQSGQCIRIPQLLEGRKIPPTARVNSYNVTTKYGLIWICLAEEPASDIPDYPEWADQSFRTVTMIENQPSKTSSTRMIMGTLDDTHFPWVHEGILGNRDEPAAPEHRVWREGQYLVVQYDVEQPPNLATTNMSAEGAADLEKIRLTYTDYVGMPNVIRLVKDSDAGRYVVWLATCPAAYNRTVNFWAFSRNYDMNPERDAIYEEFSAHVRSQDKPIIESQRPWLIPPFWSQVELPLGPADKPLMEFQKWLEELGIVTQI